MLHASAVDDDETMGGGSAKWVVVVAGAGPTREVLRFELTIPTDGASAPTIAPLSRTSLDGSAVGMAWSDGAAQRVRGAVGPMGSCSLCSSSRPMRSCRMTRSRSPAL